MNDILSTVTQTIFTQKEEVGLIFSRLRELHDYFASITGIASDQMAADQHVALPTGKAIGPAQAAHCLLEGQRTAVFVRGIHNAIKDLQTAFLGQRINILYAGCGPYATLLTPLTTIFSADEVSFHLMDINETSLASARTLFQTLGLDNYVSAYTLTDAATYKLPAEDIYHLMISETMQQSLKKEPQVAIMQNLIPQLPPQGIFIPQQIDISAQLLNPQRESESFMTIGMVPDRVNLGSVYTISKEQLTDQQPVTLHLQEPEDGFNYLNLMTDITVYDEEVLTTYNCSLNLPVKVTDIRPYADKHITFRYEISGTPGLKHELN